MTEAKLMKPLFDGGMFNREGHRMRAVFLKEVSDGTTAYRLWRKDGKPEVEYPRCDNDQYILHVEINGYLIPLRETEFRMIDNCGFKPAFEELYGGSEGRAAYFDKLRERDGWSRSDIVGEAMKREEETIVRYGSQPERWVARISEILESHISFYRASKENGGLTHPDYVGACILNELDTCVKLSAAHREFARKAEEDERAEREREERQRRFETNAKADAAVAEAIKAIREGGRLINDRIDYYNESGYHDESLILHLMRRYQVNVPLRTQGWICEKLSSVNIEGGRCSTARYFKSKGGTVSQRFFDCMNELIEKVKQEGTK